VIVLQDAFGVNDYLEDVCRRLAAEGYTAVAPHLFHRSGDPLLEYGPAQTVMPYVNALTEKGLLSDSDATIQHLTAAGFAVSQIGVLGFCMGGTVAFRVAVGYGLGAAVTLYGGGILEGRFGMAPLADLAPKLRTPWLGLYGDRDLPTPYSHGIPVAEVEALREVASGAAVPTEVVRYPEAEHAFHCDRRPSYHAASAKDAWRRTLDWFGAHMGAGH
jgi:carboxymethylenebutenolidase